MIGINSEVIGRLIKNLTNCELEARIAEGKQILADGGCGLESLAETILTPLFEDEHRRRAEMGAEK